MKITANFQYVLNRFKSPNIISFHLKTMPNFIEKFGKTITNFIICWCFFLDFYDQYQNPEHA